MPACTRCPPSLYAVRRSGLAHAPLPPQPSGATGPGPGIHDFLATAAAKAWMPRRLGSAESLTKRGHDGCGWSDASHLILSDDKCRSLLCGNHD